MGQMHEYRNQDVYTKGSCSLFVRKRRMLDFGAPFTPPLSRKSYRGILEL